MRTHFLVASSILLTACGESVQPPTQPGTNPGMRPAGGLVEITITGITSSTPVASARGISVGRTLETVTVEHDMVARSPAAPSALIPLPGGGTVQLEPLSTTSFTHGARGAGGYRYVSATYRVRNADQAGVAYGTQRTNLTFIAVSGGATLAGTAITTLRRFDDTNASPSLAAQLVPAGSATLRVDHTLASNGPDVLQGYTEAQVAAITPPSGVTDVLSYGFVTRTASSSDRILAANPAVDAFDGLVTFAYTVPLQPTAAADPFTISALFLPVDDDEKWVTQGLQETDATGMEDVIARATGLGAGIRIARGLDIAGYPADQTLCSMRYADLGISPAAFAFDSVGIVARSPDPFGASVGLVASNAALGVTYTHPMVGATAATFAVRGSQSGRFFAGASYTGAGTTTLATPAGTFRPGEEIEVTLVHSQPSTDPVRRTCLPAVYRYRVASAAATMLGAASNVALNGIPGPLALADLNHDGHLDTVVLTESNGLTVRLGDGAGNFSVGTGGFHILFVAADMTLVDANHDAHLDALVTRTTGAWLFTGDGAGGFTAGTSPLLPNDNGYGPVVSGDLNGDGELDLVLGEAAATGMVRIALGNSSGGFARARIDTASVGLIAADLALGDVNSDGILDLVAAGYSDVRVFIGNGVGGFTPGGAPIPGASDQPAVALGDFNGDGNLDVAAAQVGDPGSVVVALGDGTGDYATPAPVVYPVGTGLGNPSALAVADVDGDGDLDIVAANRSLSTAAVLLGVGDGTFGLASYSHVNTGGLPISIGLGDVNGDTKVDLVTSNRGGINMSVHLADAAPVDVTETGLPAEADYCAIVFPSSTTTPVGIPVQWFGRVYEAGITDVGSVSPLISAYVGYGPQGTNPRVGGWTFVSTTFNLDVGNDDEYVGSVGPFVPGTYSVAFRFSVDNGASWTYCDLDGAGSNGGLTFEANQLATLTVQ